MGTSTLRHGRRVVVALLLAVLAAGCGDDEIPGVDPAPTRSVSTQASADEIPGVTVTGTNPPPPVSASASSCEAGCLLRKALAAERSDLESQATEDAQAKLAQLRGVPADTVPALRFLAQYQWRSATAKDLYGQARRQAGLD